MSSEASAERQRLLASIAADLLAAEETDQVLGPVCDRVRAHLDLAVLVYHLIEGTGDRRVLRLRASSGLDPETASAVEELPLDDGICGIAVARCARVVADATHALPEGSASLARRLGLHAMACHPLVGPEGVLATLFFGSRTRDRFGEDELWVMGAVSSLAALAIGRTRFARALEESQSRLSLANVAAGQGLWEIDLRTSSVELSDKARELFGIEPGAPLRVRTDWRPLILPEDQPALTAAIDNARAGSDYQSEFRIRRPSDGRIRWILARGRVLPGTSRLVGVLADVTEAHEAADAQRRALVESERMLQALREKEKLLRLAMVAARGGVFILDLDEQTLELSPEAAALHGFSPGTRSVSKAEAFARLDEANRGKVERAIRAAAASAHVSQVDYQVEMPGEGRKTLAAFGQVQPQRRRIVGFVMDVSDRCAIEDALREANRRKSEFIAILSHELRNPLAPIVYALPVIERAPLENEAARALAVVKRQMSHLERLVDDLLDISRINSGKVELRRERVNLRTLIEAAVESTAPLFEAARHRLEVSLPDRPVWLDADPHRLAQALTNLLSNAARYTPRGGRVRLLASRDDGRATVRVQDNGIGIAPNLMPRIFEMFHQIDKPEGLQGGLGIGLALARSLIVMHGGTIEAHSEGPGRGAEFVVTLPVAPSAAVPPPEPAAEPVPAVPLKVLIVDDNADLVEVLATLLTAEGHDVRKALDGPSALAAARVHRPDVVLLDLGLPMMSGVEVAQRLRARPETRGTHLVALTGWGQDEDLQRTREAGFDDHLTKPTDPQTLLRLLNEISRKRS